MNELIGIVFGIVLAAIYLIFQKKEENVNVAKNVTDVSSLGAADKLKLLKRLSKRGK